MMRSTIVIEAIPALNDNYIWVVYEPHSAMAWVVDPGVATPVEQFLAAQQLQLAGILITHHHGDHTQGVEKLTAANPVLVYGPKHPHIVATQWVKGGEQLSLATALSFQVIAVPGHTLEHVAYYSPELKALFCGDTLFAAGCGRIFEGTAQQMYASLQRLATLPEDTQIYCAHEYTWANLQFAQVVEPSNAAIYEALLKTAALRAQNLATLPTTLAFEKQVNPFLRCDQATVRAAVAAYQAMSLADTNSLESVAIFASLRAWKDNFKPG